MCHFDHIVRDKLLYFVFFFFNNFDLTFSLNRTYSTMIVVSEWSINGAINNL